VDVEETDWKTVECRSLAQDRSQLRGLGAERKLISKEIILSI
jgi:hypothetical protein